MALSDKQIKDLAHDYAHLTDEEFARAVEAEVRKQVLEECAQVCDRGADEMLHAYKREGAARCAEAIRARGKP